MEEGSSSYVFPYMMETQEANLPTPITANISIPPVLLANRTKGMYVRPFNYYGISSLIFI